MEHDLKEPLLIDQDTQDDFDRSLHINSHRRRSPFLIISVGLNALFVALSILATLASLARQAPTCQYVFSPAQEAIEYRTEVFRTGLKDDVTEYMGSSDEVLRNWEALYNFIGISQIDEADAKRLPNATTPTSYDASQYMVQLDVFHTLHCLNLLRKTLYPAVYPPVKSQHQEANDNNDDETDRLFHLEHCVESIRQSLQCSSDVSTIYWEWSEQRQQLAGNLRTTHTCRNFAKIQDWAKEHAMVQDTDMLRHMPGAPLRVE